MNSRLTLDYGVRLVHQQPPHDTMGQASNFFPDRWSLAAAPRAVRARAAPTACIRARARTGRRMNPVTGQFLGPNSSLAIGTLVPNTGNPTNGLIRQGQGIAETTFIWPALALAPRFGMAYDVTGKQRFVLRGGARPVLRPAERVHDHSGGRQSADRAGTSPSATASCRASAAAA